MRTKYCVHCGSTFEAMRATAKYCSRPCGTAAFRDHHGGKLIDRPRYCRQCGTAYLAGTGNQQHCSRECARKSARESRCRFYARNPEKDGEYREKTKARTRGISGGNMARYRQRYPEAPMACQSCGEGRVLDIAHKPEHRREGAWRSNANTTPEKIWILCPTCHALIDRVGYDPATLGLS